MSKLTHLRPTRDIFTQLNNEINRMISPFETRSDLTWQEASTDSIVPTVDVQEEDTRFVVRADLPGVKAKDIDISIEGNILTIKGRRQMETKAETASFLRLERVEGTFLRQIPFTESINESSVEATCSDGVLEIVLPKQAKGKEHKIKVKEQK